MLDIKTADRSIAVEVMQHKTTGLLVAQSEDLPGLMVAARTYEQLEREIPEAIKEVLEASGSKVVSVDTEPKAGASAKFAQRCVIAHARLSAA